jgi:hypothetical protein
MSELESSNLGLISINTERKNSDKEIQVKINDEKARLFGINKTEVASFISLMTNGVRAGSVTLEDMDDSWDVLIFVPEDERTIDKLLNMNILGEKGWVPIKAITELREEDKTSVIRRTDGKRTLVIRADVEEEVNIFNIIEDINATVEKEKEEYLKNIKSNYQDYLKKKLNSPLEEKVKLQAKTEESEEKTAAEVDTSGHIVPNEKVQALKRQEFVDIISTALGIKNLSYAEKGKLYELWQTFKEFNRELLIDIVDDIRDKTPDFNDNFLYYLAQIKNIYLEKSKEDLNYDRY